MENYKEFLFNKDWLTSKGLWIDIFQFKDSLKYYYRGGIINKEGDERFRFCAPITGFLDKEYMLDEANRLINKMLKNKVEEYWEEISMSELWDLLHRDEDKSKYIKPTFPTRRWGEITTKISTTDKKALEEGRKILSYDRNRKSKIKLDKENTLKFKNLLGSKKLYKLEILNFK